MIPPLCHRATSLACTDTPPLCTRRPCPRIGCICSYTGVRAGGGGSYFVVPLHSTRRHCHPPPQWRWQKTASLPWREGNGLPRPSLGRQLGSRFAPKCFLNEVIFKATQKNQVSCQPRFEAQKMPPLPFFQHRYPIPSPFRDAVSRTVHRVPNAATPQMRQWNYQIRALNLSDRHTSSTFCSDQRGLAIPAFHGRLRRKSLSFSHAP